jgi:hypothetical protein
MNRRVLVTAVTTVVMVLVSLFGGAAVAQAATTHQMFLTFYGWYDNTPPGGDISYPQIHDTAGGKGTYADPITFATSTAELKAGTKVWVPRVRKYFIMEDSCQECGEDWSGHGPNGGPGLRHIDLWLGGKGGNAMNAIDCEDALTHYNPDNTPTMEPVVVDPSPNEAYDSTPIFNTSTGACYGGAQPNTTVGQYKNPGTGQCMDDPNNSSTVGTALKVAACTGAANQVFTFHGAFLVINNRCLGMSGSNITLQNCDGGPKTQWSINPSGTISDIQTGGKCIRVSGANLVAGSCSGAASQWAFTSSGGSDFSLGVSPNSGSVAKGGSTTANVTTAVTSGTAQPITFSASGLPTGVTATFSPASAPAGGSSTVTFATSASTPAGAYTVTVTGTGGGKSHATSYSLTVTAPASDDFSLALSPTSGSVSPGSSTTTTASTAVLSGNAQSVALTATGAPAGVSVAFAPASVTAGGSSAVTVSTTAATAPGSYTITVTGTASSATHSASFGLTVTGPPGTDPVLLSQGKPATASSVESSSYPATAAFDGNLTSTRWSSKEGADPQWLRVDLGATASVSRVKLSWEAAYGKSYTIQTSPDGTAWTTIFSTTTGNGATDDLTGLTGTGRYVRVNGTARGTAYGYSLFEMQVYGVTG